MATVYVSNAVQATLYHTELTGQMSDGMWENSNPRDHWKIPSGATVVVDAANPRLDFTPRRSYGFTKLIEYVGDRMLQAARARLKYPNATDSAIGNLDSDYVWEQTGEYYEGVKASLSSEFGINNKAEQALALKALESYPYTIKDLKQDLRAIQKLFTEARR